ncbi:MAG: tRNA (adenosine(37)-N6)-dimethylallyltransferase MiaA [Bacilli bacterium]|nr:tRNA (adenosine(37)-N6)-dimethylallyltransferase MiaA [Bacilli bacterium]
MSKIICLVGPTATGKTKLSIELAHKYNAIIINADSTQIYKEPIIATAKITEDEKENVSHYMLDLVSLNADYTLFDYQKEGRKLLDKFIKEDKNIVIVGGSGLYIKALLYDYNLDESNKVDMDFSIYNNKELKSIADRIDSNNDIHINNRQRLERFIRRFYETGKVNSKTDNINKRIYDFTLIGLKTDRETLYQKANDRVDKMFEEGLLEEAKKLYSKKYKNFTNIIGYKELNSYFNNEISLDRAKELIKQNTRHYAKRQFTWFNNQMKDIIWFDVNYDDFNKTINEIINYIEKK